MADLKKSAMLLCDAAPKDMLPVVSKSLPTINQLHQQLKKVVGDINSEQTLLGFIHQLTNKDCSGSDVVALVEELDAYGRNR